MTRSLYPSLETCNANLNFDVNKRAPVNDEEEKMQQQSELLQKQISLLQKNMKLVQKNLNQEIKEELELIQKDIAALQNRDSYQQQKEKIKQELNQIQKYIMWVLLKGMSLQKQDQDQIHQLKQNMKQIQGHQETSSFCNLSNILIALLAVVAGILAVCFFGLNDTTSDISVGANVQENLEGLQKDFPSQSSQTWKSLKAGARDFAKAGPLQRPLVILLTGDSKDTRCLAEKYIQAFERQTYFLDAAKVTGKDYGETIDMLKEKINKTGAVLLHGLQNLDGNQANALHVVCDRESPLVRDAIVVLTADTSLNKIGNNWKDHVSEDKLPALLTRIGSRVVVVFSENILPCAA